MKKRKKKLEIVVIASLIVVLILLMCLVVGICYNDDLKKRIVTGDLIECTKNSDCLIVRGSCCSCEEGGAPKCIAKASLGEYMQQLESCSREGSCIGIDCGKISCGCIDGKCIGRTI